MEPGVGTGTGQGGSGGCWFLYYAYGSNLLRERLLLSNPSAALYGLARLQPKAVRTQLHDMHRKGVTLVLRRRAKDQALDARKDFKLEFGHHQGRTSSVWHGGTATIVQSPGDEVWGIVWKMNTSNLSSLDKQEGVEAGIYVPIEVNVQTQEGEVLTCRSYQMQDYVCGPPSPQYKKVICMGAKQNGLPADYQKKLEAIETNNYAGPVPIMEKIEAAIKEKENNST